jgi:hypothetical protein
MMHWWATLTTFQHGLIVTLLIVEVEIIGLFIYAERSGLTKPPEF